MAAVRNRSPRQHEERAHHLYLIKQEPWGPIKIGVSKKPPRRRSQLQISTPAKLTLEGTWRFGSRRAIEIEALLKKAFAPVKLKGEWFEVEMMHMRAAISFLHANEGGDNLTRHIADAALFEREAKRLYKLLGGARSQDKGSLEAEAEAAEEAALAARKAVFDATGFYLNTWDDFSAPVSFSPPQSYQWGRANG